MDLKSEGFCTLMTLEDEIILYQCSNKGRPTVVHREWDKILLKKVCEMAFKKYEIKNNPIPPRKKKKQKNKGKGSNPSPKNSGAM